MSEAPGRRVVLFGASGFIGGHVRAALEADTQIDAVICPGRRDHDLIDGDHRGLVQLIGEHRPTAIVCCVGRLGGTDSELIRGNTLVATTLLEAVAAAGPGLRLVRLGSAGEYGIVADGHAVTEEDPATPVAAYGVSHLAGTRLFQLAGDNGLADTVSLRVFNPIGPGMSQENMLGRAADRIRSALATGADEITMGPLSAYRDFVDVRDLAEIVPAVLRQPRLRHRVFNVGSGRAVRSRQAVRLLAETAGYHGEIREQGAGPRRSAAVDWIEADVGRARAELGWAPSRDLATSIKDIWAAGEAG
ncbi:NAD-dependent epimerase/dehydratase family protein [Amorphoplanes digitatis]|uniref:Nucleoside-diphosphate-sugar epimerase n=1 Tax=Actinoplanes digitatis TaxID=1868 RepID=A0A7W7I039_9ACTN|nr:NAD(P)-dependent oxidoreductase [Actinoplanes digitatis]MBB4763946.1 nucleoside-diphosphate-sugar epimerase [Actinoplanes digitatis]GID93765.1 reductase [Actinoplanes digitatis]